MENPSESPKFKEFTKLLAEKSEVRETIKENNHILKTIANARVLERKLPEESKQANAHVNELKTEFSSFFEDNIKTSDALDDIENYIKEEQDSFKDDLKELNTKLKSLEIKPLEKEYSNNTLKRESESKIYSQSPSKKLYGKDK